MKEEKTARPRIALENLLKIFTEVRADEALTVGLMASNIFLILTAYYLLKPVREALMSLEPRGPELASYAAAVMAVLLVPIVRLYGWLGERYARRDLISIVTGFFILNLAVFFLLAEAGTPYVGFAFFVWVGIFNILIIAQFWAYGNDIYSIEQGKRLFPLILLGQTVGAILGPLAASYAVEATGRPALMLPLAALLLGACVALTFWIDRRESSRQEKAGEKVATLSAEGGFKLIWKTRYLLYIALLILVLNLVNTTGEYILRDSVFEAAKESEAGREVFVAGFYSTFFFRVNVLSTIIQAVVVSRILKFAGVRVALFILPAIALGGYGLIAVFPVLILISAAKTLENSVDYSLMNTLRAALYLPTTREMKYKAKQAIDTFFVRAGDVVSAGAVFAGIHWLGLGVRGFAALVVGFVLLWLILAALIAREYGRQLSSEN